MRSSVTFVAPLFAALSLFAAGCGEDDPSLTGTIVPTHTETVRGWLEGVSQSGQLDSGAMTMKDEIAKLKEEGVKDADALSADFDALMSASGPAAVKKKAQEMLTKLPPPPTVSRMDEKK